jgi:hypothetical protein
MENLTFNQKKKIKNFEKYIQGIEIFLIVYTSSIALEQDQ